MRPGGLGNNTIRLTMIITKNIKQKNLSKMIPTSLHSRTVTLYFSWHCWFLILAITVSNALKSSSIIRLNFSLSESTLGFFSKAEASMRRVVAVPLLFGSVAWCACMKSGGRLYFRWSWMFVVIHERTLPFWMWCCPELDFVSTCNGLKSIKVLPYKILMWKWRYFVMMLRMTRTILNE